MKLATHGRESQATYICHFDKIRKLPNQVKEVNNTR